MRTKAETIAAVCQALGSGTNDEGAALLRRDYPFVSVAPASRGYSATQATRVFIRDGFRDRYSGAQLVYPGVLRLVSHILPEAFPFHPNWKMSATHPAYWELTPTVDHVVPIARGGQDREENWVTTSMLRNAAKGNWLLEELGWTLYPADHDPDWDGLMSWFVRFLGEAEELRAAPGVRDWYRVALQVRAAA